MSLRYYLLHNFWLKFFSLVLATLVWIVVYTQQTNSTTVPGFETGKERRTWEQVSVTVLKTPTDTRLYKITPAAVNVTLAGSPATLDALKPSDLEVFINLANMRYDTRIHQVQVYIRADVNVLSVSPASVAIERFSP